MHIVNIAAIAGSLLLFGFVIDFVRRNLLKEKYSVLWIALSLVVLILSVWTRLLDKIAGLVGISYAPSLLFLVAFIFILLILLHFSVVISILHEKNKVLTQELVLFKSEFEGGVGGPVPKVSTSDSAASALKAQRSGGKAKKTAKKS